jgi:hypothetical protein
MFTAAGSQVPSQAQPQSLLAQRRSTFGPASGALPPHCRRPQPENGVVGAVQRPGVRSAAAQRGCLPAEGDAERRTGGRDRDLREVESLKLSAGGPGELDRDGGDAGARCGCRAGTDCLSLESCGGLDAGSGVGDDPEREPAAQRGADARLADQGQAGDQVGRGADPGVVEEVRDERDLIVLGLDEGPGMVGGVGLERDGPSRGRGHQCPRVRGP